MLQGRLYSFVLVENSIIPWSISFSIRLIRIGTCLQQFLCNELITFLSSLVQCGFAPLILAIYVYAGSQQPGDNLNLAVKCGRDERVDAIYITRICHYSDDVGGPSGLTLRDELAFAIIFLLLVEPLA